MPRPRVKVKRGDVFGRLTVVREASPSAPQPSTGQRHRRVICRCSCGSGTKAYRLSNLKAGGSSSCGCKTKEFLSSLESHPAFVHGRSKDLRLYTLYRKMMTQSKAEGRGKLRQFGTLELFEEFLLQMRTASGARWTEEGNAYLTRIDTTKGFTKSNLILLDNAPINAKRIKGRLHQYNIDGKIYETLTEAAQQLGVSKQYVHQNVNNERRPDWKRVKVV